MRLQPLGSKLLIAPREKTNHRTEAGIEIVQNELAEGVIIEVSDEFKAFFNPGDVVLYSMGAGNGEYYKGQSCMWIDGRSPDKGGDVWAVCLEDTIIQDKGDDL